MLVRFAHYFLFVVSLPIRHHAQHRSACKPPLIMSSIKKLQSAKNNIDLANLLGYKVKGFTYIVYTAPKESLYKKFKIPKRDGSFREICAPEEKLKYLQKKLAMLLQKCDAEIDAACPARCVAHGFKNELNTISNAKPHRGQKYVVNFDLSNYFDQFNFGRVRGFFISNPKFLLSPKVATAIAQIATFENKLPQGSPCSPVIANLITRSLDNRLLKFCRANRFSYTRYADDITISSNLTSFPDQVVCDVHPGGKASLSLELSNIIEAFGFEINPNKTRVFSKHHRQLVTNLVVNEKVNVPSSYYRATRSMCHQFFMRHKYQIDGKDVDGSDRLRGRLSYIFYVRDSADKRDSKKKKNSPRGDELLYRKFLNFITFRVNSTPLLVCEGKTDSIYIKCAINHFKRDIKLRYFKYSKLSDRVMLLGGGTSPLKNLISKYREIIAISGEYKPENPVILLVDNDDGAKDIFNLINQGEFKIKNKIGKETTEKFYHLIDNLYLIKIPENGSNNMPIEHLFDEVLRNTKYKGRSLSLCNDYDKKKEYGKSTFAEEIVSKRSSSINFDGFSLLLDRIEAAIADYAKN